MGNIYYIVKYPGGGGGGEGYYIANISRGNVYYIVNIPGEGLLFGRFTIRHRQIFKYNTVISLSVTNSIINSSALFYERN